MIRQQLEIINRRELGYPLLIAEKDYFMAIALNTIYSSDLKDRLLFKGGTALHHRDFYDLYFLLEVCKVALKEAVILLQRKEARIPIISSNIQKNWLTAKKFKNQDLENIFCTDAVADEAIEALIQTIQFDDIPANVAS